MLELRTRNVRWRKGADGRAWNARTLRPNPTMTWKDGPYETFPFTWLCQEIVNKQAKPAPMIRVRVMARTSDAAQILLSKSFPANRYRHCPIDPAEFPEMPTTTLKEDSDAKLAS